MNSVKLFDKAMYNINASDYAKTANEVAKRSKNYAMELVDMGVRGNLTKKDIITLVNNDCAGMYDEKGNLTKKGIKEMIGSIREMFQLDSDEAAKKIKIKDIIDRVVNDTNNNHLNIEA